MSATSTTRIENLPVAIIGAGPIGLAAAAHLVERDISFIVLEAGSTAGAAITNWGHTRLFSPWEFLVNEAAARLLDKTDWEAPAAKRIPYGRDLVASYLLPLAQTPQLAPHIRYNTRVVAVSREGMDRTRSERREESPFLLRTATPSDIETLLARAVIDTSGTYSTPNKVLSSGLDPVESEEVSPFITPALPDVLGVDRATFVGRHTVVVGAGHSAANTLLKLAELAELADEEVDDKANDEVATSISWIIRSATPRRVYGSAADELAARGELGSRVQSLVTSGRVTLIDSFEIDDLSVNATRDGVIIHGRRRGEAQLLNANVVANATGFRPDLTMLGEIRLSLDDVVEAPTRLASLIDPNLHSCGTVYPHGVDELMHPEPNFFLAGMKSYGRAPTFLLATGYEQVRSIADELAGNPVAARQVQLVLPETGVCNTSVPVADDQTERSEAEPESCCSSAA